MNRKEEKLLREFVRENLVAPLLKEQKKEPRQGSVTSTRSLL